MHTIDTLFQKPTSSIITIAQKCIQFTTQLNDSIGQDYESAQKVFLSFPDAVHCPKILDDIRLSATYWYLRSEVLKNIKSAEGLIESTQTKKKEAQTALDTLNKEIKDLEDEIQSIESRKAENTSSCSDAKNMVKEIGLHIPVPSTVAGHGHHNVLPTNHPWLQEPASKGLCGGNPSPDHTHIICDKEKIDDTLTAAQQEMEKIEAELKTLESKKSEADDKLKDSSKDQALKNDAIEEARLQIIETESTLQNHKTKLSSINTSISEQESLDITYLESMVALHSSILSTDHIAYDSPNDALSDNFIDIIELDELCDKAPYDISGALSGYHDSQFFDN